jgi:hypothetical protein
MGVAHGQFHGLSRGENLRRTASISPGGKSTSADEELILPHASTSMNYWSTLIQWARIDARSRRFLQWNDHFTFDTTMCHANYSNKHRW